METSDFHSIIQKSKKILVITPPDACDDVLSSAFALENYLRKKEKQVAVMQKEKIPQRLSFLAQPQETISSLSGLRDFVLIFQTKKNKIISIQSEETQDQYIIRITPQKGSVDPRDFSFMPADFKFDLLIILNSPNLDSLGSTYEENTDLFFEVPKINIDNHSSNENYAQVNIVDMTASSISEICSNLILSEEGDATEKTIDQEIAQALLTGIIAGTESFQKPTTTPKAMILAAKLMKFKADQPTVIRHLYKTKALSFLKLWGRVMARLEWNEENKTAWSLISAEDFKRSGAKEDDVPYVLEEIQKNFSQGLAFALIYTTPQNKTRARFHFVDKEKSRRLASSYGTETSGCFFTADLDEKSLVDAEKEFLEKMEELE